MLLGLNTELSAVSITQTADWTFNVTSSLGQDARYDISWSFAPFDKTLGTLVSVDFNAQLNATVVQAMLSPTGLLFPNVNIEENIRFSPASAILQVPFYYENVEGAPVASTPGEILHAFSHDFIHLTAKSYDTSPALAAFTVPQTLQIGLRGSSRPGANRFSVGRQMKGDLDVSITYNYAPITVPERGGTWLFLVSLAGVLIIARSFRLQRST